MSLLRSVLGIAAGFLVIAALLGFMAPVTARAFGMDNFRSFSMGFLAATLAYTVVASVAGGYLAAWIAGRRALPHAAAVGLLMIGMSVISMRRQAEDRPGWYETTIAGCGPVAVLFGAGLRRLRSAQIATIRN